MTILSLASASRAEFEYPEDDPDYIAPALYATPRSPERQTYGPELAAIGAAFGTPFMPHQQQICDVAMEVDPITGELAYGVIIVILPRRGGKTTIELSVAVHRALAFRSIIGQPQSIVYTAQTGQDGYGMWLEQAELIQSFRSLAKQTTLRQGNNNPSLRFRNGSRYKPLSVTTKSGHSGTNDAVLMDEIWAHEDNHVEDGLSPTMASREQPQHWMFSRGPRKSSSYQLAKMKLGRRLALAGDTTSGIAYFEWGADREHPRFDRRDPRTWRRSHPAVGRTVSVSFLRLEQKKIDADPAKGPEVFDINYLNLEPLEAEAQWTVFTRQTWNDSEDWTDEEQHSQIASDVHIAIDTTPTRDWSSIGVGGKRADGLWHGEIIEHAEGTTWLAGETIRHCNALGLRTVVLDGASPANEVRQTLEQAGLTVVVMSASARAAADSGLHELVESGQFRHLGQPELTAGMGAVIKRTINQAWGFTRHGTSAPISPAIAVASALWHARTTPVLRDDNEILEGMH